MGLELLSNQETGQRRPTMFILTSVYNSALSTPVVFTLPSGVTAPNTPIRLQAVLRQMVVPPFSLPLRCSSSEAPPGFPPSSSPYTSPETGGLQARDPQLWNPEVDSLPPLPMQLFT